MTGLRRLLHPGRRFGADQTGLVFVEFAMTVPVLALLLLGAVDFGRYVLMHQKMQRTATTVADLVSQSDVLTTEEVGQILLASQFVMTPFTLGSNGLVIVSSVSAGSDGTTVVNWQESGGGTLAETSRLGGVGEEATMPAGFLIPNDQTVMVAEIWFKGGGFFSGILGEVETSYHTAVVRPRFAGATSLN